MVFYKSLSIFGRLFLLYFSNMKLFPSKKYSVTLYSESLPALEKLKRNTKHSDSLISSYTDKIFIGIVNKTNFKIITSFVGFGAFCVFVGEFKSHNGIIEIKIHKVFKGMLLIILSYPFIGLGLQLYQNGLENISDFILLMIFSLSIIRFGFIKLLFRIISNMGFKKLSKMIGIVEINNNIK